VLRIAFAWRVGNPSRTVVFRYHRVANPTLVQ
jgi:hypothetical protein